VTEVSTEQKSILIIEDEDALRSTLSGSLRGEGYEGDTANNAIEGFEKATNQCFDLIILDIMLPSRKWDVCCAIRQAGIEKPILLLTPRSQKTDAVLCLRLGADDFVTKPFNADELSARSRLCCGVPPSFLATAFHQVGSIKVGEFRLLRYLIYRTVRYEHFYGRTSQSGVGLPDRLWLARVTALGSRRSKLVFAIVDWESAKRTCRTSSNLSILAGACCVQDSRQQSGIVHRQGLRRGVLSVVSEDGVMRLNASPVVAQRIRGGPGKAGSRCRRPVMRESQFTTLKLVNPVYPIKSERLRSLHSSLLFLGMSEHDCAHIASAAVTRTFARRETLFTQGEEDRNFILLLSGNVKHTQASPDGVEALLRISSAGDIVCVQGLSSIRRHTCSGRATEECCALVWEHDQMQNYLRLYPRLCVNMTRILAAQLNELEERFREVATERLTRRLALLLLRLSKQMGKQSGNGTKILLSREEIAQMAGVTIFSISRMLSRWTEQGLILTPREAVIVCDLGRLELMIGT
jgi:CRP-like cAMP-binding protein